MYCTCFIYVSWYKFVMVAYKCNYFCLIWGIVLQTLHCVIVFNVYSLLVTPVILVMFEGNCIFVLLGVILNLASLGFIATDVNVVWFVCTDLLDYVRVLSDTSCLVLSTIKCHLYKLSTVSAKFVTTSDTISGDLYSEKIILHVFVRILVLNPSTCFITGDLLW